ncbi:MAG: viroplasmin family protein [Lachnospiraceae bacterium]|nr:viroplasmin family protein [Lachnospiraceae bacterium]
MKKKIYAVKKGEKTGIYNDWKKCEKQIKGFPGALYSSFEYMTELEDEDENKEDSLRHAFMLAEEYMNDDSIGGLKLVYQGKDKEYIQEDSWKKKGFLPFGETISDDADNSQGEGENDVPSDEPQIYNYDHTKEEEVYGMLNLPEEYQQNEPWVEILLCVVGDNYAGTFVGRYNVAALYTALLEFVFNPRHILISFINIYNEMREMKLLQPEIVSGSDWVKNALEVWEDSDEYRELKQRFEKYDMRLIDFDELLVNCRFNAVEGSKENRNTNSSTYQIMEKYIKQGGHSLLDLYREMTENSAYRVELMKVSGSFVNPDLKKSDHITKTNVATSLLNVKLPSIVERKRELDELRSKLFENIYGQDIAIDEFLSGLFYAGLEPDRSGNGPKASYLFIGPPGVGKTYLAKSIADLLGVEARLYQMNEYMDDEHSASDLIGHDYTWKDSHEGSLTGFVKTHPNAVLIFDEIEKACSSVKQLFLSILEGGFLTDKYSDEKIKFSDTICIFTTNAGRQFFEERWDENLSSIPENTIIDAIKNDKGRDGKPIMPPELLSRLQKGKVILFNHINEKSLIPVVKKSIGEGKKLVEEGLQITYEYDEETLPYLFLYSMGNRLDARIASERSKKFVMESVYRLMQSEKAKERIKNVKTTLALDGDVAKRYFWEADKREKRNLIVVCGNKDRKGNYSLLEKMSDKSVCSLHYVYQFENSETKESDKNHNIRTLLRTKEIDGILIDFYYNKEGGEYRQRQQGKAVYESLLLNDSVPAQIYRWLQEQPKTPPIYAISFGNEYRASEKKELLENGIEDIISLPKSEYDLSTFVKECFLQEQMQKLQKKGRRLDYNICMLEQKEEGTIELEVGSFREVNDFGTDADVVMINDKNRPGVTFNDVIGNRQAVNELRKFKIFLEKPDWFRKSGAKVSRGILMLGAPGTGKTMLAKALANEADCPFISCTGVELLKNEGNRQMQTGDGVVKDIHTVFSLARKYAPSIIFIDEIDVIAKDRIKHDGDPRIINQLLTEMDGFETDPSRPVFVIAATNYDPEILDEALLRRFGNTILIKKPGLNSRTLFIKKKIEEMSKEKLAFDLSGLSDADVEKFARVMSGQSLAEIENVINYTMSQAVMKRQEVDYAFLYNCFEEYYYGLETKSDDGTKEFEQVTYHEAGHALMGFLSGKKFYPDYATVVSRGGFGGYVDFNIVHRRKEDFLSHIRISLAGRAAEVAAYGENRGVTIGLGTDLKYATSFAKEYLTCYAMEDDFMVSYLDIKDMEKFMTSPMGEKIYKRINEILVEQMSEAKKLLEEHRDALDALQKELYQKRRLEYDDMREILKPYISLEEDSERNDNVKDDKKDSNKKNKREGNDKADNEKGDRMKKADSGDELRYLVYTDGGATPNPGVGGYGVVIIDKMTGERREYKQGYVETTNNRMELRGAIRALEELSKKDGKILLKSDSDYLRSGITEWINNWIKNDWRNSRKKPVENSDLWKKLSELIEGKDIEFEWVKGHDDNNKVNDPEDTAENNCCDILSKEARDEKLIEDEGYVK